MPLLLLVFLSFLPGAFCAQTEVNVTEEYPRLDASRKIVDLVTGEKYRFEVWNNLMILKRKNISIDTFITGSIDHYFPDVKLYYQTFISYPAVSRGSPTSGATYIFCVVNSHIVLAAVYCCYSGYYEEYNTKNRIRKVKSGDSSNSSYQLLITEDVQSGGAGYPEPINKKIERYKRTHVLIFDSIEHIFFSDSVVLDRIESEPASAQIFTGKYPAIVLRNSTTIHKDCWRWVESAHRDEKHYIRHLHRKRERVSNCE